MHKTSLIPLALLVTFTILFISWDTKKPERSKLKDILNIYWMPEEYTLDQALPTRELKGFYLNEDDRILGYAGCNSFEGRYAYHGKTGFKIGDALSREFAMTQRKCGDKKDTFLPNLGRYKSFTVRNDKLVLKGPLGEVLYHSAGTLDLTGHPLTQVMWKMTSGTHPSCRKENGKMPEPIFQLMENKTFVLGYDPKDWQNATYLKGFCNLSQKNILLKTTKEVGGSAVDYEILNARQYKIKDGQLILKSARYEFVFRKME